MRESNLGVYTVHSRAAIRMFTDELRRLQEALQVAGFSQLRKSARGWRPVDVRRHARRMLTHATRCLWCKATHASHACDVTQEVAHEAEVEPVALEVARGPPSTD